MYYQPNFSSKTSLLYQNSVIQAAGWLNTAENTKLGVVTGDDFSQIIVSVHVHHSLAGTISQPHLSRANANEKLVQSDKMICKRVPVSFSGGRRTEFRGIEI